MNSSDFSMKAALSDKAYHSFIPNTPLVEELIKFEADFMPPKEMAKGMHYNYAALLGALEVTSSEFQVMWNTSGLDNASKYEVFESRVIAYLAKSLPPVDLIELYFEGYKNPSFSPEIRGIRQLFASSVDVFIRRRAACKGQNHYTMIGSSDGIINSYTTWYERTKIAEQLRDYFMHKQKNLLALCDRAEMKARNGAVPEQLSDERTLRLKQ
jgi:hypothetical protein